MTAALLAASLLAAGPPELVHLAKVWDEAPHNAFTDLIRWDGRFWITFRESSGHVGGDGRCRVLVSGDGREWRSAALVAEAGVDLRDPKLSVTPEGRLMLTMGGTIHEGQRPTGRRPRVAFSADGMDWSGSQPVLDAGDWLWRVTWHRGVAYGVSYRTPPGSTERKVTLYRSDDGSQWRRVTDLAIDGSPNETTLRFVGDTMIALVRREAGDRHARIGTATPPYEDWSWNPTEHLLGGPNFIEIDGTLWAAGRHYPGGARTELFRMTTDSLTPALTLPSGGDTSYPGLLFHDGLLWISYYSSHGGRSAIYLAKVRLPRP